MNPTAQAFPNEERLAPTHPRLGVRRRRHRFENGLALGPVAPTIESGVALRRLPPAKTWRPFGGLSAFLLLVAGCATFHPQPIAPQKTAAAFNARSLEDPGLRAFLETNHVTAPAGGEAWNLKQLTLAAFYYQPALAEARAQLLAAQAAQITAGQRPNPSLSVTPAYDSQIPGAPSPWIVPVSVDVPIETAGKRGYRLAQARHLAEAARWNLVGTVWQVRSGVRAALLNLYAARQTESLLARQAAAQSNVVRLLEGQLAAGNVSSYEVTQARIALDTARLAEQQAAGQLRQARAQLANALGVPLRALDGVKFSFADFEQFPGELTRPEIRRQALWNRADVRAALANYAASQAALQLEIANQYPDLHLGPGYAWNSGSAGDNEWSLGLTLTLPILNQNQGPIAEARANRQLAAAHFLTVQAQAISQIESALINYQTARRQVAAADALLKNLRRRLDSVRAQVRAGEAEPLALASAEAEFDAGAQSRLNALIQAQQALGQLEDAVQSPLTLPLATLRAAENNTVAK
jgi:cobalt-zinc-cadmium efflux system outer membrane protein